VAERRLEGVDARLSWRRDGDFEGVTFVEMFMVAVILCRVC